MQQIVEQEKLGKELEQQLDKKLEAPKVRLTDIYICAYKRGPVRREVTFRANSPEHAEYLFHRFMQMLKARENEKCVQLGKPAPLALDIEQELEKFYKETGKKF